MSSFTPPISDAFVDQLLADMERLGNRPYAEIGVPMFLVAEDLTASPKPRENANHLNGAQLTALFAQAAQALQSRRPELTPADVARLVEVIADRHFLAFATPPFSQISALHPEVQPGVMQSEIKIDIKHVEIKPDAPRPEIQIRTVDIELS